jgi:hypothetical protein
VSEVGDRRFPGRRAVPHLRYGGGETHSRSSRMRWDRSEVRWERRVRPAPAGTPNQQPRRLLAGPRRPLPDPGRGREGSWPEDVRGAERPLRREVRDPCGSPRGAAKRSGASGRVRSHLRGKLSSKNVEPTRKTSRRRLPWQPHARILAHFRTSGRGSALASRPYPRLVGPETNGHRLNPGPVETIRCGLAEAPSPLRSPFGGEGRASVAPHAWETLGRNTG